MPHLLWTTNHNVSKSSIYWHLTMCQTLGLRILYKSCHEYVCALCHYLIWLMSYKGQAQWVIYLETGGVILPLFSDITRAVAWCPGQGAKRWEKLPPLPACSALCLLRPLSTLWSPTRWKLSPGAMTRAAVLDRILRAGLLTCPRCVRTPNSLFADELGSRSQAAGHQVWLTWESTQKRRPLM